MNYTTRLRFNWSAQTEKQRRSPLGGACCAPVAAIVNPLPALSLEPLMPNTNEPKDGDFASYLEGFANRKNGIGLELNADRGSARPAERKPGRQTIQHVLAEGQEPTTEFLEELQALNEAPDLSDEELERQALLAPGDDGNVQTPE